MAIYGDHAVVFVQTVNFKFRVAFSKNAFYCVATIVVTLAYTNMTHPILNYGPVWSAV